MDPTALALSATRAARNWLTSFLQALPGKIGAGLKRYFKWLFGLNMIPMILAIALTAIVVFSVLGALGLDVNLQGQLNTGFGLILLLLLFAAIYLGVIRGR